MMNERDSINSEIEKYKASIKRIKNIIPLVTVLAIMSIIFFNSSKSTLLAALGIMSVFLYAGSFVFGYLKCKNKIIKLEKKLSEIEN